MGEKYPLRDPLPDYGFSDHGDVALAELELSADGRPLPLAHTPPPARLDRSRRPMPHIVPQQLELLARSFTVVNE